MNTLTKIQAELKVPKGNYNAFAKFKYRSAEDILEAVKPLLLKHSARLILTDEIVIIGTRLFSKATAKFSFETETEVTNGFAELSDHKGASSEQCNGIASSYSRKYALNGLFLIDETESDPDAKDNSKKEPVKDNSKEIEQALLTLQLSTTIDELVNNWKLIGKEMQATKECVELKEKLKTTLK